MKILFVVPCYSNDFPVGLGYLCPPLMKMGVTPDIFIPESMEPFENTFIEKLRQTQYDMIGISALYPDFRQVIRLCEIIRKERPAAVIVLGGILLTCTPEFAMKKTGADIGAIGEAEITIVKIVEALRDGAPLQSVRGIIYRDPDGTTHRTEPGLIVHDPDEIDNPAWHLFPMEQLILRVTKNLRAVYPDARRAFSVVGSRGCPFSCNFCTRFTQFRRRKVDRILDDIEYLIKTYEIDHFALCDNLALSGKDAFFNWAEKIHERGLKITYDMQLRFDPVMTKPVLEALYASGCRMVNYGLESADQKMLDSMNKKIRLENVTDIVRDTKEAGIITTLTCMFGQPDDNEETLRKTLKMYLELTDVPAAFTACTPFPSTELFDDARAAGLIKDDEDFFNRFTSMYEPSVNLTKLPDDLYARLIHATNLFINDHKNMRDVLRGTQKLRDYGSDMGVMANMISRFQRWLFSVMSELKGSGITQIAIYGCGKAAELAAAEADRAGVDIVACFDGNPEMNGQKFHKNIIRYPRELPDVSFDAIVITAATDASISQIRENIVEILKDKEIRIISLVDVVRKYQ